MVNTKRIRLFENDVTITGKHYTYIKFLVSDAQLFDDYIDVYLCGAVVGYLYNTKSDKDNSLRATGKIYADAFSNHREDCMFLYRLITLLDNEELDNEERVNRAFRYDGDNTKEEVVKECVENFNAYVRGGIECMYKDFTTGCTNRDDYIVNSIKIAKKFKDELSDDMSYEERLKQEMMK